MGRNKTISSIKMISMSSILTLVLTIMNTLSRIVNLNITSLNIRKGVNNKIENIVHNFNDSQMNVGKIGKEKIEQVLRNTDFKYYFSEAESQTKGVITIISKKFENQNVYNTPCTLKGRFCCI